MSERIDTKIERWDRWIESHQLITGMPIKDLVVHPDDWEGETEYTHQKSKKTYPVVVLGYVDKMRNGQVQLVYDLKKGISNE